MTRSVCRAARGAKLRRRASPTTRGSASFSFAALTLVVFTLAAPAVSAALLDVERLWITARVPVLDGQAFGDVGAYEKVTGMIHFVHDPDDPANALIVDLALAPRNADGLVESFSDFMLLRPVDAEPGTGTALLEVSNRGGKASLSYFNRAASSRDPTTAEHFGDGLLMRQGLTVMWVGWQWDVPATDDDSLLRLRVPRATDDGAPLSGLVRADWVVDEPAQTLPLAHRDHIAYPVSDPDDPANVLTWRSGRDAERTEVPREQWRFVDPREVDPRGGADASADTSTDASPDASSATHADFSSGALTAITMDAGFTPGRIYECVYRAQDPAVVGLGLAAIRDTMDWLKDTEQCEFAVEHGLGLGISQTGRFLRHFLYQGFNTSEDGEQVFDGLLIHSAGAGRGSFNHRFAQPSRDAHRYSAFSYPTDIFPFSGRTQMDPEWLTYPGEGAIPTGEPGYWVRRGGLLERLSDRGHLPRIMYTNTGYEYWGRAASLLHTSVDGRTDVEPRPEERIYHLASGQHFVSRFPPTPQAKRPGRGWRGNPLDFLLAERALLVALQAWVEDGVEPPPSAYPRLDEGTLINPAFELDFPMITGVTPPAAAHHALRADYGPQFEQGVITVQPPILAEPYPARVSQVDEFGNERAGVPSVEILAPLATYTPWIRRQVTAGSPEEMDDFYGTFVPLSRTDAQAAQYSDPRPSIESLYSGRDDYLARAKEAAMSLVKRRTLLPEDVPAAMERAQALWDWVHSH